MNNFTQSHRKLFGGRHKTEKSQITLHFYGITYDIVMKMKETKPNIVMTQVFRIGRNLIIFFELTKSHARNLISTSLIHHLTRIQLIFQFSHLNIEWTNSPHQRENLIAGGWQNAEKSQMTLRTTLCCGQQLQSVSG